MSDRDELIATALIGDEAKRFLESELGRFVLGVAKQQVEMAKDRLLDTDPDDTKTLRKLQMEAQCGLKFEEWLVGIINDGEQSLEAFRQQTQG